MQPGNPHLQGKLTLTELLTLSLLLFVLAILCIPVAGYYLPKASRQARDIQGWEKATLIDPTLALDTEKQKSHH